MPNDSLTPAQREAYALADVKDITLETLQVKHPSAAESFYLVKDTRAHLFTLEDGTQQLFEPCAINMTKPKISDSGLCELNITIDNTDKRIGAFIEKIKNTNIPVEVYYRPYLLSDPTTPQWNPPLFLTLTDVSVTRVVSAKARFADIINRPFPNEFYTRREFPSLANSG